MKSLTLVLIIISLKKAARGSYGETKLGQGREAVKQLLKDNPELAEELENKIRESITNNIEK